MDSKQLKAEAMAWLRFGRRMPIVCTEAGGWNADVLGMDDKSSIEVEVKISKADLKADFTTKSNKHFLYKSSSEAEGPASYHIPNQFYFLVPRELKDDALKIIGENAPAAGVAIYAEYGRPGDRMTVVKRAKKLHNKPPEEQFRRCAMLRMGSELIALYHVIEQFKKRGERSIDDTHKAVLELVDAAFQAKDHEETYGD